MIIIHRKKKGRGLVNKLINKLPIELYLPGYQYCDPRTKLAKRFARGDTGINLLDLARKEHDIAYSQNRENLEARHAADRVLANKAWERVLSRDADISERAAAYALTNAMNLKTKLGQGLKKTRKKSTKRKSVKRKSMKKKKTATPQSKIIKAAKSNSSGNCAKKAINHSKAHKDQIKESRRHNKSMEAIALGKGLYLKPYKSGYGLYLKSYSGGRLKKRST